MNYSKSWLSSCVFTIGFWVICVPALADQCSYISKEQGITAISRLDIEGTIYFLCEPCGEKVATSAKINNLSLEKVDYQDFWQVKVNNEGIDLAYVFVDSGLENNFMNLAAIANCPAESVSPILPKAASVEDNQGELEERNDREGS